MKIILAMVFLAIISTANAGGSHEKVKIIQFSTYGDGNFLLVVSPQKRNGSNYRDPYMGKCRIFSILGRYEDKGIFESGYIPSREKHNDALEYLSDREFVELGWMGQGFRILNPNDPCLVNSRALEVIDVGGDKVVASWTVGT